MAVNATIYKTIPTLLVVEILTVPEEEGDPLVPPAMLRIKPKVMRSWTRRNCLTLKVGFPRRLIQSTLQSSALLVVVLR